MKVGFNMLLWTTHVTEEHFPIFERLKAVGYDGVEIPLFEGEPTYYRAIGKALDDLGLEATTVALLPDEAHNALSPDAGSRQGAVDHLKWAVDCNAALGSKMLMGPYFQPLGVFTGEGPSDAEKERCADVHRTVADYAAQAGVSMAIEPLNRFECYFLNTIAQAKDHVARVGRPNFRATFDTFHANIEEKDPIGCIAPHIAAIGHVHISENDRGTPGRGHIDFPQTILALRRAGYDGWLTVEAFGQALEAIKQACRIWRPLFVNEEQVYTEAVALIRRCWNAAA